ncbi:MAG: hypothetical protein AAFY22_13635 [Pseudomonadota bacterium]
MAAPGTDEYYRIKRARRALARDGEINHDTGGRLKGALFAVLAVAAPVVATALIVAVAPAPAPPEERSRFAENIGTTLPETLGVLQAQFADEFPGLERRYRRIAAAAASEAAAREEAAEMIRELRRRNASFLLFAPDSALKTAIEHYIALLTAVRQREDRRACNAMAIAGPGAFSEITIQPYTGHLDRAGAALLTAISEGRAAGLIRERTVADDWAGVRAALLDSGAGEDSLAVLAATDRTDIRYCDAAVAFLSELLAAEGVTGVRARAAFVAEIGKS